MKPNHVYSDVRSYQSGAAVKFYDSVWVAGIKLAAMAVIFVAAVMFILAGPAQAGETTYCKTWYGATIPIEQHTPDNTQVYTPDQCHSYIADSRSAGSPDPAVGTAPRLVSPTAAISTGTYFTPSGTYMVSRAGSATFINRVSGGRR